VKTIGLIGGMSWESSLEYYRLINEMVKKHLGEPHSCQCIMYSVDFADFEKMQHKGEWGKLTDLMVDIAKTLENAGADFTVICANTMHKMSERVEENIGIPLLHIADATAQEIKAKGMDKVGLLGTKFTMEEDFYKGRLKDKHGIDVVIPSRVERDTVHDIIYHELISGIKKEASRTKFIKIIEKSPHYCNYHT